MLGAKDSIFRGGSASPRLFHSFEAERVFRWPSGNPRDAVDVERAGHLVLILAGQRGLVDYGLAAFDRGMQTHDVGTGACAADRDGLT